MCYVHKPEVILRCHKQELIFGNLIANSGTEAQGRIFLLHQTLLLKSLHKYEPGQDTSALSYV